MPNSIRHQNANAISAGGVAVGTHPEHMEMTGARSHRHQPFLMLGLLDRAAGQGLGMAATSSGAPLVLALNPKMVRPSAWSNRHPTAFLSKEYHLLKEEILSSGGNVQPIKVRPLGVGALRDATEANMKGQVFEIVYGHRRHRACLELGLKVLAVVEDLTDTELFAQMDRENRQRENLSPWEQGSMYARALDAGLFHSMRQLARAVGCNPATISRSVALARLPEAIVCLFRSPTEIQTRWAKPLSELAKQGPHVLQARIERVAVRCAALSPVQIYAELVAEADKPTARGFNAAPQRATLCHGGRRIGEVLQDSRQGTMVRFYEKLTLPMFSAVAQGIQRALNKF